MPFVPTSILTYTFVTLLVATTIVRLWLARRHITHMQANRGQVPTAFKENIALDEHQKAADYSTAKTKLAIFEVVVQALLLIALTLGGGLQWIDNIWRNILPNQEIIRGALVICSASLVSGFIELPFDYYRIFGIEEKFGFNKMSRLMFIKDMIIQSVISIALGTPLLFAALWLMHSAGQNWWLYLWLVFCIFALFISAIYPTFISPLLNKFTPLEDVNLILRIETLLSKCGFKSQGLFIMDGSKRSSHGNAHFTGLGASKRVVFFDTLLERLNVDEIESVLAHELGHFKHKHIFKLIALQFLMSFLGLALLGWLIKQPWFYAGLGVTQMSNYMALMLFLLVSPIFLFLLRPIMASYLRKNEFEADDYAANHASAKHLVKALVKLYRDNATTLTPDPLHSAFYDSHPPASIRISKLAAYTS